MAETQRIIGISVLILSYITSVQLYLGMAFQKTVSHLFSLQDLSEVLYVFYAGAPIAMATYFPVGISFIIGLALALGFPKGKSPKGDDV